MKTLKKILVPVTLFIIGLFGAAQADVVLDNFNTNQSALTYKESYHASDNTQLYDSVLFYSTRKILSYSGLLRKQSSYVIISNGRLYIDNTIDKNQKFAGRVTLEYNFNNENFDNYSGIKITTNGSLIKNAKVSASVDGPSEQSYAGLYAFNSVGEVILPFSNFKGAKLFNNINNLRIDFVNIKFWSGELLIELIEK